MGCEGFAGTNMPGMADRAACVPGASDEGKMPGRGKDNQGAVVVSCTDEAVCSCEGSQARRLTVGVNAVDAPRRVHLHAQPASHLILIPPSVALLVVCSPRLPRS